MIPMWLPRFESYPRLALGVDVGLLSNIEQVNGNNVKVRYKIYCPRKAIPFLGIQEYIQ